VSQSDLLTLLHDSLSSAGADVDVLIGRLETVHRGTTVEETGADYSPLTTEQLIALGFLACVKAIRESGLMSEIAVREEIQQIHDLGTEMRTALGPDGREREDQPPPHRRPGSEEVGDDHA
jgi:hypothetical protein